MTEKVFFIVSLLIAGSLLVETRFVSSNQCYNYTQDFYPYLGSRTPYVFVHGHIERPQGCEPLQMWMTARHGTRYPDTMTKVRMLELEATREQILINHDQGRGQLCLKDLTKLRLWRRDPNFYEDKNGTLAYEGRKELHLLANRLKKVFPELLGPNDPKNYNFITTMQERATSSLRAFASALLNISESAVEVEHEDIKDAKNCPRWLENWDPKVVYAEQRKFTKGPILQQTLREISDRLGFNETMKYHDAKTMYEVCRYETALNPDYINVWCQMFSKNDLIVFEYVGDLDYYYSSGPGNKLSSKLNCGVFKKLFDNFARLESGKVEDLPKGLFTFGHSTNVQSIMSQLRVYESEPPMLASNFHLMQNRTYRLSLMGAFCTNVAAIFYRCNDVNSPLKVMFHNSENEINVPGCNGGLCDWEYLKREFGTVLDECDLNFCDISSASGIFGHGSVFHLLLTVFVILSYEKLYLR